MKTKNRLSKVLASVGIASRRACEELIFSGKVTVNGAITLLPQTMVSLEEDEICVDKVPVAREEKKLYFILNKPKGFICSNVRPGTKKIVKDLFGAISERLFTVGRLDRDTTGLLLVTNDGHFANKVIHPSSGITKEYLVKTEQEPFYDQIMQISRGVDIDGDWVKPVRVTKVRKGTLKVVVREGKKREVRLLVQQTGLKILELKRIRIGGLVLGDIPEGTYREMTETEKAAIFS